MRNYFKNIVKIIVFIGFGVANAGSYEDFFVAVKRDDVAVIHSLLARPIEQETFASGV